jgi:hypothetical protein
MSGESIKKVRPVDHAKTQDFQQELNANEEQQNIARAQYLNAENEKKNLKARLPGITSEEEHQHMIEEKQKEMHYLLTQEQQLKKNLKGPEDPHDTNMDENSDAGQSYNPEDTVGSANGSRYWDQNSLPPSPLHPDVEHSIWWSDSIGNVNRLWY